MAVGPCSVPSWRALQYRAVDTVQYGAAGSAIQYEGKESAALGAWVVGTLAPWLVAP